MPKDIKERVRPFSCGTQFMDWNSRNCRGCIKYDERDASRQKCEIDWAFGTAFLGDGTISEEIAERSGHNANQDAFVWDCPERVAVDARH